MRKGVLSVTSADTVSAKLLKQMPIYTKNGDAGDTDLYGGIRVRKSVVVIEALGELDELNAFLGLTRTMLKKPDAKKIFGIQNDLFVIGSVVSGAYSAPKQESWLKERIVWMEKEIDTISAKLPPLKNFILPNGCESSARLHMARSICRRCERSIVALEKYGGLVPYLNRLSDYLFVLARYENFRRKISDERVTLDRLQ